jgi:hypothetical protein
MDGKGSKDRGQDSFYAHRIFMTGSQMMGQPAITPQLRSLVVNATSSNLINPL